jgi:hypothetical protein
LHLNFLGGALDVAQIVGREFDCGCADVLLQAMQLCGAWDWHDPRLPSSQASAI